MVIEPSPARALAEKIHLELNFTQQRTPKQTIELIESLLQADLEEVKHSEWLDVTRSCELHIKDLKEKHERRIAEAKREAYEEGFKAGEASAHILSADQCLSHAEAERSKAYLDAAKILYDKAMLLPGGNARTALEWGMEKLREKASQHEAGE